jgi:hypothetical protein
MPEDFDKCVREGGKVVTKDVGHNQYIHICYDKEGNSHHGEVKTRITPKVKTTQGHESK